MTNPNSSAGPALPSQRHLFDIPDDVAFLNCAYISPLPKASLVAGDRGLRRKARPLLRLDPMAAPNPRPLGVPPPALPGLCPTFLPPYALHAIFRLVLVS